MYALCWEKMARLLQVRRKVGDVKAEAAGAEIVQVRAAGLQAMRCGRIPRTLTRPNQTEAVWGTGWGVARSPAALWRCQLVSVSFEVKIDMNAS